MKLINEKGKIFGLINIVDLIVLVIIIAIAGAVCFRAFSPKVNAPVENVENEYCYVTVLAQQVVPEAVGQLKVGDHIIANNEITDAEIVSISDAPASHVGVNSEGKAVLSEHPLWRDLTVVIKEKIDPSTVVLKVGGQEARVNYSYILKTQQVECNSRVRGIEFKAE
ncbi:MAG: DUF4330 domain-containing protein [Lachnospirales bacterium]